jgi:hypothetical protein
VHVCSSRGVETVRGRRADALVPRTPASLDTLAGVIEDAVVSRGGTWVGSHMRPVLIPGISGPVSTLGRPFTAFQTVFRGPENRVSPGCASAYTFQCARVAYGSSGVKCYRCLTNIFLCSRPLLGWPHLPAGHMRRGLHVPGTHKIDVDAHPPPRAPDLGRGKLLAGREWVAASGMGGRRGSACVRRK